MMANLIPAIRLPQLNLLLSVVLMIVRAHNQNQIQIGDAPPPDFLAPLDNQTVVQGREVQFTCIVNNLGPYKVAWIKSDSKAILAIHTHMVALNTRISVTHNGHNTWKLHIQNVQQNDTGSYMCQVNTDPMRSISGHLEVNVPPDILNEPTETEVVEGLSVELKCTSVGKPEARVHWRREDNKNITLRHDAQKQVVKYVEGERLALTQSVRTDMGIYLCIANNGIPPSVSKRFPINVNFSPSTKTVTDLVTAPTFTDVTLRCLVEAFPKPLLGWYKREAGSKIYNGSKYTMEEALVGGYTWTMNLTIKNLQKSDAGEYACTALNALGKADATVSVRCMEQTSTYRPTTPTPSQRTTPKPHVKHHNAKGGHKSVKHKEPIGPNQIEGELLSGSSEVLTQQPAAKSAESYNNVDKTRNTQLPASVPSSNNHWVYQNGTGGRGHAACPIYLTLFTTLFLLFRWIHVPNATT